MADTPARLKAQSGRSRAAWEAVTEAHAVRGMDLARYGTLVFQLPSMLQTSGLGQTCAFLYSNGDARSRSAPNPRTAEILLLVQLGREARLYDAARFSPSAVTADHIMATLVGLDLASWRVATHNARELASWMKRFV
jgi:CRISPR/Cas system CMR-associated protein Cmr5 small subunit